ncbi:MAG: hypothetical protein GOMPHAMPRED_004131 [Gomphillus americanus]|uniref:Uncharacterized protein n=1 Tax=Gomphillus americanus TaxID=1940652 RepID=A0A8H3FRA2_9LECA|nr:MAG: hypothetical protein GOMPHAMPRED_004131 [Gomphillus americanus]
MLGPTFLDLIYMHTSRQRRQLYARSVRCIKIDTLPERRGLVTMYYDNKPLFEGLDLSLVQEVYSTNATAWQLSFLYCPAHICGNLSKLELGHTKITSWALEAIGDRCSRLKHLKLGRNVPGEAAGLVANLRLLQTLDLAYIVDGDGEFALFDAVARHKTLQSVNGLPIKSSWIQDLRSSQESSSWFTSLTHAGVCCTLGGILGDPHLHDYAESLWLTVEIMPNLVSLKVQSYTERVLETLVTLDKIQQLEIVHGLSRKLRAAATLELLTQMKNLRILHIPGFHRCRKETIHPTKASLNISWTDVEAFTRRMPNLEKLSFSRMHLHGMTPSYAPTSFDYSPVTWTRNLGWEILDWEFASRAFKDAMSNIGKFMPHNYFGPYHEGVDSVHEYIEDGRQEVTDKNNNETPSVPFQALMAHFNHSPLSRFITQGEMVEHWL